jgi:hypothetical protein
VSETLDVLVVAKTVGTTRFPVEPSSLAGIDRASGRWVRLVPFRFGERDSDPPVRKWSWLQVSGEWQAGDPRPESFRPEGEVHDVGYVEAKDGWKLRWPFVRPHLRESLELLTDLARGGVASAGFVRPAPGASIALDSMTLRFRCLSDGCQEEHALPILDWEVRETTRALHEREPLRWRAKAEEMWGPALFERFDVHVLLSSYAQAPTKLYVAGLFYPPKAAEDQHQHAHHVEHRQHATSG